MDSRRFDEWTRTWAHLATRRQALRAAVGGIAGILAGSTTGIPPGAQRAVAAVTCSPDNRVTVPCNQLNDYIRDCGVICPDGATRLRNHGGCTQGGVIKPVRRTVDMASPPKKRGKRWCAKRRVTIEWAVTVRPQSSMIDYQPGGDLCCPPICQAEVAEVLNQLAIHEEGHVAFFDLAAAEATGAWLQRMFNECGNTPKKAKDALDDAERQALRATEDNIRRTITTEPPQARLIDCAKCAVRQNNTCPSSAGITCTVADECCGDFPGQFDCVGGHCCVPLCNNCTTSADCCAGSCMEIRTGRQCVDGATLDEICGDTSLPETCYC